MKLYKQAFHIKAPVEHVFHCLTDIEYLQQELTLLAKEDNRKLRIQYNSTRPFAVGNKIRLISNEAMYDLMITHNAPPHLLQFHVVPLAKTLKRWGEALIRCECTPVDQHTKLATTIDSQKQPGLLMRVILRFFIFIVRIRSKKDTIRMIKHIEDTADL